MPKSVKYSKITVLWFLINSESYSDIGKKYFAFVHNSSGVEKTEDYFNEKKYAYIYALIFINDKIGNHNAWK